VAHGPLFEIVFKAFKVILYSINKNSLRHNFQLLRKPTISDCLAIATEFSRTLLGHQKISNRLNAEFGCAKLHAMSALHRIQPAMAYDPITFGQVASLSAPFISFLGQFHIIMLNMAEMAAPARFIVNHLISTTHAPDTIK
jgi:hypothetical protein